MRNHIQIELQLQPNPDFYAQLWQRTFLQQSLPAAAGAMSNAAVSAEALPDAEEQALHRRKKSYCHTYSTLTSEAAARVGVRSTFPLSTT